MHKVRLLGVAVLVLLPLMLAGTVVAQTPAPIERTPEMEEQASELAALFPDTIAGASLVENLEVAVGQELIGDLDPSDADDARDIEQIGELVAVVDATLDDMAAATSYAQVSEDAYAWVIAYQIRGADIEQTLPLFMAAFEEDIPDAIVEEGQVGDEPVTLLRSGEDPEGDALVFVTRGDVLWLVSVPSDLLQEVVGSLPQS